MRRPSQPALSPGGLDSSTVATPAVQSDAAREPDTKAAGMRPQWRPRVPRIVAWVVRVAAVFAVLGVLPLITLTQIGIIVCIGVLLDTLLVRTVLVPALAFVLGDRFWWPGRVVREEPAAGPGDGGPGATGDDPRTLVAPATT